MASRRGVVTPSTPHWLAQVVALVAEAHRHLAGVRQRWLGNDGVIAPARLNQRGANLVEIYRFESFGAQFDCMQKTGVDKLMPAVGRQAGEPVAAAIDNRGRMERVGLIPASDDSVEMGGLRNCLATTRGTGLKDWGPTLERACPFSEQMPTDDPAIRHYAVSWLGADPFQIDFVDGENTEMTT